METTLPEQPPSVWITALEAYDLVAKHNGGDPAIAIATRAHAEMVRTRAALFTREHKGGYSGKLIDRQIDAELPAKFWWAKGHVALDQDWAAGDFSTWIEQTYLWEAFGVKFAEADILAMLSKSAPPAAPNPVSSLGTVSANASRPSDRTRGRRLTHDHPYAAASAALRLVNLSPVERGKLSGPSVGKDLEEHYRAAGGKIPHEDSLDDYGASVLSALEEFWAAQGK